MDVILIDDNKLDNFINQKIIQKSGIAQSITMFDSPTEALVFFSQLHEPRKLLIFLDIQMPRLSGFDVLDELLKLDEELRFSWQVIMLSSSIDPEDQKRAREYFPLVKDFVSKPLSQKVLEERLTQIHI